MSHIDKFVFYPMQVCDDTQIKINGKGWDNEKAVDWILDKYTKDNCRLVIKPHPAERNVDYLKSFRDKYRCVADFSMDNTKDLLRCADLVVTINSTVGLESLILGKKPKVLGKSLFADFDQARTSKYILEYLIDDVDYFGTDDVHVNVVERIICKGNCEK